VSLKMIDDAFKVVRLLAGSDATFEEFRGKGIYVRVCRLCSGSGSAGDRLEHEADCPYQLALNWMENYDQPNRY
jgi:hypothetical protein